VDRRQSAPTAKPAPRLDTKSVLEHLLWRPKSFDKANDFVYSAGQTADEADMGVEGKDKAKALEAGAAAASGQLGRAVLRMRKTYNLSLAELSDQSGVAKSIISQIERNETNPTLTTIWRLAHALGVPVERILQGAEEGPIIETASAASP
jgi:DNA-binding XRE family transcriptional regulator